MLINIYKGNAHKGRGQMEILGKKSKLLLILLMVAMLTATVVSLAIWDGTSVASAATGNMAVYANAKVGDIVTFGSYYQDASGTSKTPIEWLVVDKDEKSGQLTLLAKHVLAGGSYWGNWFYNSANSGGYHSTVGAGPAGNPYNQNWADSTLRAWLNNLERTDVHGDNFSLTEGIKLYDNKVTPSKASGIANNALTFSYQHSDLKYSVGYSNKNHWTGLSSTGSTGLPAGMFKRQDNNEVYYKRPRNTQRPAVNGFLDEAFSQEEQERIVPKVIPGQVCHEWPSNTHFTEDKTVTPTTVDKIWVPSTAELNIEEGKDWTGLPDNGNGGNNWSAGTDNSSSDAFAFFRQFQTVEDLTAAIRATGTEFDRNPQVGNFSIPLDVPKTNIGTSNMQKDMAYKDYWGESGTRYYWTRTPASSWYSSVGCVQTSGAFHYNGTNFSNFGARPALILSYN